MRKRVTASVIPQRISKQRLIAVIVIVVIILIACSKCYTSYQKRTKSYLAELSKVESYLDLVIYGAQRASDSLTDQKNGELGPLENVMEGITFLDISITRIASLYDRDCSAVARTLPSYVDFMNGEYKDMSNESKALCLDAVITAAENFQFALHSYSASDTIPVDDFLKLSREFALDLDVF